jgi:hypothetical protein
MKKDLVEMRKQQQKENIGNKSLDISNVCDSYTGASRIVIGSKSSEKAVDKPSKIQKKAKITQSDKNSTLVPTTPLHDSYDEEDDYDITCDSLEYSLSPVGTKPNQEDEISTILDDAIETSCTVEENDGNNVYLEKIKELSDKVNQQKKILKERTAMIKRLQSTTIGNY